MKRHAEPPPRAPRFAPDVSEFHSEKLKAKAAKFERKKWYRRSIEIYTGIIDALEGVPEIDGHANLLNKVGDIYLKMNNLAAAVAMYQRAIDRYTESDFPRHAIALCKKILRNAPGRTPVYLELARLMVQRGLVVEGKHHLLEYAERMHQAGKLEEAFTALEELVGASPDNEGIGLLLAEQLQAVARTDQAREQIAKLLADVEGTGGAHRACTPVEKTTAIDPHYNAGVAQNVQVKSKRNSSEPVFLGHGNEPFEAPADDVGEATASEAVEPLEIEPTSLAEQIDSFESNVTI